jgi:o-succinylbenzoate synthase
MRITDASVEPVGGATREPVSNAARRWEARHGVWLRLRDEAGHVGVGESSPLPGYSPDSLDAVAAALGALDWDRLANGPDDPEALGARLLEALPPALPSARFAVETAWLDLLGQRTRQPLWALLQGGAASPAPSLARRAVPLSELVPSLEPDEALRAAEAALRRGIGTIKVKIGRSGAFDREHALLARLRAELGPAWRLRLDANGALDARTAHEHLARLAPLDVELVEEPVPAAHLGVGPPPPVPVGLDESLTEPAIWERVAPWIAGGGVAAAVLKPTLLGGLGACRALARRARALGLAVTVSHTFDGPVALAAAAHLALAVASPARASGLAPHPALAAYPRLPLPMLEDAAIVAPAAPGLGLTEAP